MAVASNESPNVPPQSKKPFRFSLRELFVGTFLVCFLGAAFSWRATAPDLAILLAGTVALILIAYFIYIATRWSPIAIAIATVLGLLFVGGLFRLEEGVRRDAGHRMDCRDNLRQIALALQQYEADYGRLPPPYIPNSAGKPMHSWRVLILPYLQHKEVYDQYSFNEPWDGPKNCKLHEITMKVFTCPCETPATTDTSYVVVVGPQTVWPSDRPIRMADIIDGWSTTLLVVEVHRSGIHWMEPRDLHVMQIPQGINPPRGQGISGRHRGTKSAGAQAAFADGTVGFLPDTLPPETIRALLSRNGKEPAYGY